MADSTKAPAGRVAESVDFDEVNKNVDSLVQDAIELLRKNSGGKGASATRPDYNPVDLSRLRGEVDRSGANRDATNLQIGVERDRMNDAADRKDAAVAAKSQADQDSVKADQERAAQEAKVYADLGDAMGVNVNDIAALADRMRIERPRAEQLLQEVQDMQSVGLLDNPLDWFMNQLQMPAKTEAYNRQADKVNGMQNTLDASLQSAANAASFNTKAIPSITAAQAAAKAGSIAEAAKIEQAKQQEELARHNVTFAVQRLANDLNVASATNNMTSLEITQAHHEYQAMITGIQFADNNATRMLKAAELLEKLEKTKGLDVMLDNYDRIMGHPKGTTTRYNFERFGQAAQQNIVAIGAGSGGSNPLEAMINFGNGRPGALASPASIKVHTWLQDKTADIGANARVQSLDEKQKPLVMNKLLLAEIDSEKDSAYKPGTLFYQLHPAEMLASGQIAADSKLAQVLEPYTKDPNTPVTSEVIVAAIRKAYPNIAEAAIVLSEYYQKNVTLRNANMNLNLFKIGAPKDYKVPMNVPGYGSMFRGKLNLTDTADAAKYLIFKDIKDRVSEIGYTPTPYGGALFMDEIYPLPNGEKRFKMFQGDTTDGRNVK